MPKAKDLTGLKLGRWTVISRAPTRNKVQIYWKCICDCGTKKEVRSQSLTTGKSISCGCYKDEVDRSRGPITERLPSGEAALNTIINSYKQRARLKNIKWELSREQVKEITKMNCIYCNKEPSQVRKDKRQYGGYTYNGIDRVDPKLGYELTNCAPCCSICNYAKLDSSESDFKEWIKKVYNHYIKEH